jgi:hypothetical protein
VHRRLGSIALALAVLAVAPVASALASPASQGADDTPNLWATINVCDTLSHPDTIGVRGSMPGNGHKGERMYMRFRVQYFRVADQHWHNITSGADSGFVAVGPAGSKVRQAGRLFVFAPPEGGSWQMRGVVRFEWRRGDKVVSHAAARTTAGHDAAQADPDGYSSDTCVIS